VEKDFMLDIASPAAAWLVWETRHALSLLEASERGLFFV
jgi:hypothetical protein